MEKPSPDSRSAACAVIEDVIAPLVAVDGGAVSFVSMKDGRVVLRFGRACSGCPGQSLTIAAVILPALREVDPTIIAIDPVSED
jgi:Fe-S cluster biogenesis protein NfuA